MWLDTGVATQGAQSTIEALFLEERRYPPPDEFAADANARAETYERPFEELWAGEGRDRGSWFKPWKEVYEWEPPYAQWDVSGKVNVCFNCGDRRV